MQIEKFRASLKHYLRQGGYSQKQLAHELGLHPAQLSNKLNEHNFASLTMSEVKQIVKILAGWRAINTRQEALELLVDMDLNSNSFSQAEWRSAPLNQLLETLPVLANATAKAASTNLKTLKVSTSLTPAPVRQEEKIPISRGNGTANGQAKLPEEASSPLPQLKELYGRKAELAWLEEQVCYRKARLVGLVGIGGVGKTTLAFEFARSMKNQFDHVIWYYLHNAPPLETTLVYFLNILTASEPQKKPLPVGLPQQLSLLLKCLQKSRCLLILDNFETVLAGARQSGTYLSGYEDYAQLLELVGGQFHQSCLIITSRDKPKELVIMENRYSGAVTSLVVAGLDAEGGRQLLTAAGNTSINGTFQEWQQLVNYYSGNPLALKLLAEPLQMLYDGNIRAFLEEGWGLFLDIEELLKQQFERLSELEQKILYWLAVERQAISLEELKADFPQTISSKGLVETMISLERRSMVESSEKAGYSELQPVILEYVTARLVDGVIEEITTGRVGTFLTGYALLKAETKDYIRESQRNLIISPILNRLSRELKSHNGVIERLWQLVALLKTRPSTEQGYAAGNLINLLVELKVDLCGADFSGLCIWQAYLQGIALERVNFAGSDLSGSLFTNALSTVETLAFSPDGRLLASGELKGTIRLWEVATGQCLEVFDGHSNRVWSVAFSPNRKLLVSGSADSTIRLWELDGEKNSTIFQGHTSEVQTVRFSPDGGLIASGGNDRTVRLWEVASGKCLRILSGHTNDVESVAFSPDEKLLASGSADHTIRLWNIADGQCLKIIKGDLDWVWSVAFSPDGKLLASGSSDGVTRLWDVESGTCRATFYGHTNRVYSVAFNPEGTLVASGSSDTTIRLWEVAGGKCRNILQGHLNLIKSIAFSPNGNLLASGSPDQSIRLWEIESGQSIRIYQGYSTRINSAVYSPDGKWLANGSDDNTIRLWEVAGSSLYRTLQTTNFVKSIAFSPNGKLLASGGADNLIRLWDVTSGTCLKILQGFPSWIWSLAFSPDGQTLASGGNDHRIYLWDVAGGNCFKMLEGHTNFVKNVVFSPDGKWLASGSNDYTVRLWDIAGGHCLNTLEGHTNQILSLAFSPDGKWLASGSNDNTARLWETVGGQCLKILNGHSNWVWVVGFTPDGQYLVSSGLDRKVKVWDAKTWQPLFDLQGNTGIIRTLTFDPNQSRVAGGDENYLRIWDLQTRKPVQVLKNPGIYEGLNIYNVTGLSTVQENNLIELGAIRKSTSIG
jgi:WD40 repeat protein